MVWYVLIVVTYVNSGVTVSQKDYFSKEACEAAAIEKAKALGLGEEDLKVLAG